MLQWFQNYFVSIAATFEALISFLVSSSKAILDLVKLLPTMITITTSALGYLPGIVMLFGSLSIGVSIIYLIVGRNNN